MTETRGANGSTVIDLSEMLGVRPGNPVAPVDDEAPQEYDTDVIEAGEVELGAAAVPAQRTPVPAPDWAEKLVLPDDLIGDAPWIPGWLVTREGRRAKRRYVMRLTRRRARRWVSRQRTRHGLVPRIGRGVVRTQRWVHGTEGSQLRSHQHLLKQLEHAAKAAEREARWALRERKAKINAAVEQHRTHAAARTDYLRARSDAHWAWVRRMLVAYGPAIAAIVAGYTELGYLGLALGGSSALGAASLVGRALDADEGPQIDERRILALDPGMSPNTFARMLREALEADLSIPVADVRATGHAWGFESQVVLFKKTPSAVMKVLDDLEACLSARPGSLLVEQSSAARNVMTLRALGSDPWQGVNTIPYRAPLSISVKDMTPVGKCLTGAPLVLPLLRTNGVLVGGPGSGKSTALLDIAEVLTACRDAVTWDIDLGSGGTGLDPMGRAIRRRATNVADANRLLDDAIALAKARPRLFKALKMGRNWDPSFEFPALVILIDEYPALVKAKLFDKVAELIRIGRKAGITVEMASQGANKDFTGSADPAAVPLRITLPCRLEDVVRLHGAGAVAEGWSAHRLRPAEGEQVNDASVAYIRSGMHTEPVPYRFGWLTDDDAEARAEERFAAGLPQIDELSQRVAGVDVTVPMTGDVELIDASLDEDEDFIDLDEIPVVAAIRAVFVRAGDPRGIPTDTLIPALYGYDPELFEDWADEDSEIDVKAARTNLPNRIAAELDEAGVADDVTLSPSQWKEGGRSFRGYELLNVLAITGDLVPEDAEQETDEDDDADDDA